MKRIINANTLKTIWQGTEYLVDGQAGIVEPPLVLLNNHTPSPPPYDEETQRLRRLPDRIDLESALWVTGETEVVNLTADELTAKQRATQRATLRQQWEALPAYIRGPYRDKFEAANRLLDEGDDEAAVALIEYAPAAPDFTAEQITVFNSTKASMKAGIEALP